MFCNMVEVLKPVTGKHFSLGTITLDEEAAKAIKLKSIINNHNMSIEILPGEYMQLFNNVTYELMRRDTQLERLTYAPIIEKANGKVLIAGLGLGMILLPMQLKPEVTSITVLERHQEVIDIVGSQLPLNKKVNIINEDVFNYEPTEQYDTIYFDIWSTVSGRLYTEHLQLRQLYAGALNTDNPSRYMDSWRFNDYRKAYSEGKRRG